MNKNTRKNFYISDKSNTYIEEYKVKNTLPNRSKALENIILEHKTNSNLTSEYVYDVIAKKLSEYINESLKNDITKVIQSSRSSDTNTQILIEMINALIINADEDFRDITTDKLKSSMLEESEKEVERRILKKISKKSEMLL
ncbi:hypothetical protein [Faecalimicrobium sp. JNUCC 81]